LKDAQDRKSVEKWIIEGRARKKKYGKMNYH